MNHVDAAIALTALATGHYKGQTQPAWSNMVGPFGGITAAVMLQAVIQHPECLGTPLSLTVNFCSAVAEGDYEITAKPARTNRSTQHWQIELSQNQQIVITATAVTAARRATFGSNETPMPVVPQPASVARAISPSPLAWPQRYDMRAITGNLPAKWDGAEGKTLTQMWVREVQERPLDFVSLTALADSFFPRIYLRRASFVPIGTVSMTVYFHADIAELAALGHCFVLAQAQAQCFFNGFFDQTAQLWSESGLLLATSHQIVYFKE